MKPSNLDKIKRWITSPKGKRELDKVYRMTKKAVNELVESRKFTQDELWRPFNI